jgi:hypothetical protein
MIEQEIVVVETPLKTLTVTIVTVSKITGKYHFRDGSLSVFYLKRPLALAVATRKGVRAFNTDGKEMEIHEFVERFPGTKPLLEKRPRIGRKQQ